MSGLPEGVLVAYYGDDFTGSTDAMEAMTAAGLSTVLFLGIPSPAALARFPAARCIGIAGSSRSRAPEWMDAELPKAFAVLAGLGAPILHYKVCSTFDSAPHVGSIGRAIDIGTRHMPGTWSPIIVGAPRLGRYQMFGTLFAAVNGIGYRIDRHPTMARHPVTPMREADLRLHLAQQTNRPIELIDMVALKEGATPPQSAAIPAVFIDVLDEETLRAAGQLVWNNRGRGLFSAASSGLNYALTAHWRAQGWLPATPSLPVAKPVPQIAVVSGSCSPVTASQIAHARGSGFAVERLDLAAALGATTAEPEIERLVALSVAAIDAGRSPLVFSAEGPDDPQVTGFDAIARSAGLDRAEAARRVGETLAEVMKRLLDRTRLSRVVVAGGDSSGEVASTLGIEALTVAAGLVPGAPLCRSWSPNPKRDGLEIVLKGGQMGGPAFFSQARDGG